MREKIGVHLNYRQSRLLDPVFKAAFIQWMKVQYYESSGNSQMVEDLLSILPDDDDRRLARVTMVCDTGEECVRAFAAATTTDSTAIAFVMTGESVKSGRVITDCYPRLLAATRVAIAAKVLLTPR